MIGNDVVDLGQRGVQPGAQHPRFDARVFSASELAALERSAARERLRWMLWAAKEAAYKVAKKLDASVVWAPARFRVELDSTLCGRVVNGAVTLAVRLQETRDWVHALACEVGAKESAQRSGVGLLPSEGADASLAAREFARAELAALLGTAPDALAIEKRGRIPVLCVGGAPAPADLSLSHHGRFVAYACELGAGPAA